MCNEKYSIGNRGRFTGRNFYSRGGNGDPNIRVDKHERINKSLPGDGLPIPFRRVASIRHTVATSQERR